MALGKVCAGTIVQAVDEVRKTTAITMDVAIPITIIASLESLELLVGIVFSRPTLFRL
jgi:hypothetical protein